MNWTNRTKFPLHYCPCVSTNKQIASISHILRHRRVRTHLGRPHASDDSKYMCLDACVNSIAQTNSHNTQIPKWWRKKFHVANLWTNITLRNSSWISHCYTGHKADTWNFDEGRIRSWKSRIQAEGSKSRNQILQRNSLKAMHTNNITLRAQGSGEEATTPNTP